MWRAEAWKDTISVTYIWISPHKADDITPPNIEIIFLDKYLFLYRLGFYMCKQLAEPHFLLQYQKKRKILLI